MKFAFLILGDFDMQRDRAVIHEGTAQIWGVSSLEEACSAAKQLQDEGIDCIELCGAFGTEGTRKMIAATQNRVPIGYVTHLPGQDALYRKLFENE